MRVLWGIERTRVDKYISGVFEKLIYIMNIRKLKVGHFPLSGRTMIARFRNK